VGFGSFASGEKNMKENRVPVLFCMTKPATKLIMISHCVWNEVQTIVPLCLNNIMKAMLPSRRPELNVQDTICL